MQGSPGGGGGENSKLLFTIPGKQHGNGTVLMAWQGDGNFLATVGSTRQVQICDRYGQVVDDIALTAAGQVVALEWDADGETLAILQQNNSALILWDAMTRKSAMLETNMKDLCWMKWGKTGPQLAVGSGKGNLVLYNKRTSRLNPLLGKHSKRITCGCWSNLDQLALGSDDKTISLSTNNGDLVRQDALRAEPVEILIPAVKSKRNDAPQLMSVVVGKKSIFVLNHASQDPPLEMTFVPKHGDVVIHRWAGEDSVLIGFSSGYVVGVGVNPKNPGKQLFEVQMHRVPIQSMEINIPMQRAAVCGENMVKMIDITNWKEVAEEIVRIPGNCHRVKWTDDGNVMTVSSVDGSVFSYLCSMPVRNASFGTAIVYMSSLREVMVRDATDLNKKPLAIQIKNEPSFIALGGNHVGMGTNNLCWFYACDRGGQLVNEVEYMATVEHVSMNTNMAAVRYQGQLQLHQITGDPEGRNTRGFPEQGQEDHAITSSHLTDKFLVFGTNQGTIAFHSLEDGSKPNEYRHLVGIRHVFPNPIGMRLVVVDDSLVGYIYNPVDSSMTEIQHFPKDVELCLWDMRDNGVFAAVSPNEISTFRYTSSSLAGASVLCLGTTERSPGTSPIVMIGGDVTCQTQSGQLSTITLSTHSYINRPNYAADIQEKMLHLSQLIVLGRLDEAFDMAIQVDTKSGWEVLRKAAYEDLDINLAIRVGRQMGDAGSVLALEKLITTEDRNLLAGNIALLLRDFSLAQDLLLSSSRPVTALEMRCDLMQWDQAMRLAESLAPQQIPHICLQYAEKLHSQGEYEQALERYTQATEEMFMSGGRQIQVNLSDSHKAQCKAGMARMQLKLGNSVRGMQLATECGEDVCRDCGAILEGMKQYSDAASMYEKGSYHERAAQLYIKLKDFKAATPLMAKVTTPKLHVEFAKAKEKAGSYREAADAYEKGKDMDSVVRLCLEQLQTPQRAFALARETRSTSAAELIVTYCQKNGDFRSAIEFLLVAKDTEKAIELAQAHDLMDAYALFLGKEGTSGDYVGIAKFYESKSAFEQAADFYEKAGQFHKALKLYLQVGEKALDKAIDVVGSARNENMTNILVDYLMGEYDGVAKDPNYIFRLHMALGNFKHAARTAVIIARQEQENGNYKVAHKMLFDTYKDLESQNISVPRELEESLLLLHSYVLVKVLVKQGDHDTGARMLVRVANSISKFPAHIVPILTSTVIECQRAGLKKTSFEYASMLMRPEYRPSIAEAYKKKIESIVRKPTKTEEEDPVSACPYCAAQVPNQQLDCPQCRNRIPYCIASGLKMVTTDWTHCPSCNFPALHSKFKALIEAEKTCPMCENEIVLSSITKVNNPEEFLKKLANQLQEAEEEDKKL